MKTVKLVTTILAPVGIANIHDNSNPMIKHNTDMMLDDMTTCLNFLNILIEDRLGNMIREDINRVPIILIPITIVILVSNAISELNNFVLVPVAFANDSSNVTANILL